MSEVIPMEKVKEEASAIKGGPAQISEPEKPKAKFQAAFTDDGRFTVDVDLKAAIASEDMRLILRGFMTEKVEEVMAFIFQNRARIAEQKGKILKLNESGKFRQFVNGVMGKK